MPTVTVEQPVTLQQAAAALKDKLGSRYEVTTHGSGAPEGSRGHRGSLRHSPRQLTPPN